MSAPTPGPWLRSGTFVYALMHAGWAKGVEQFKNRITIQVSSDSKDCPPDEAEATARIVQAAPDMLADLIIAAQTLRRYEELHRAKGTAESRAKADVNAALATRFEATIAAATGETK